MKTSLTPITKVISIGSVKIGGRNPIAIQSMTTVRTENIPATVKQIRALEKAGCDLVRVAVPNLKAAQAIPKIKRQAKIPLIADIHYDVELALAAIQHGADKIRINPGNITQKDQLKQIITAARRAKIPIRIGVNAGSLEREILKRYGYPSPKALVASALKHIRFFEAQKFTKLIVSIKASDFQTTLEANRLLAKKCRYPLHLGVTEAGTLISGVVKNALALGTLLQENIGATIRVSMAADPLQEITAAKEILKALGRYPKEPTLIVCPTCGRQNLNTIPLAKKLEKHLPKIKKPYQIAIMGCPVNLAGEAAQADYTLSANQTEGLIFRRLKLIKKVPKSKLLESFLEILK